MQSRGVATIAPMLALPVVQGCLSKGSHDHTPETRYPALIGLCCGLGLAAGLVVRAWQARPWRKETRAQPPVCRDPPASQPQFNARAWAAPETLQNRASWPSRPSVRLMLATGRRSRSPSCPAPPRSAIAMTKHASTPRLMAVAAVGPGSGAGSPAARPASWRGACGGGAAAVTLWPRGRGPGQQWQPGATKAPPVPAFLFPLPLPPRLPAPCEGASRCAGLAFQLLWDVHVRKCLFLLANTWQVPAIQLA